MILLLIILCWIAALAALAIIPIIIALLCNLHDHIRSKHAVRRAEQHLREHSDR